MNMLELKDIHVYIDTFYIIQGVSLVVPKGEVTVLLGRNGAGKTTTMKSILGIYPPRTGEIIFNGKSLNNMSTHKISRLGIGYVPDTRRIFGSLTVEQNLKVSIYSKDKSSEEIFSYIYDLFPDLKKFSKQKAKTLSGGQQQMLAVARALTNDNQLLLLDELTEGLSPKYAKFVMDTVRQIKDKATILLVEQNFKAATSIGDNYYIMDDGKIAHSGKVDELINNEEVITKFLGIKV